jgi:hypothetical protein
MGPITASLNPRERGAMPKRHYNWPGVKPDNSRPPLRPTAQARQVRIIWRYSLSFSSGPDVS